MEPFISMHHTMRNQLHSSLWTNFGGGGFLKLKDSIKDERVLVWFKTGKKCWQENHSWQHLKQLKHLFTYMWLPWLAPFSMQNAFFFVTQASMKSKLFKFIQPLKCFILNMFLRVVFGWLYCKSFHFLNGNGTSMFWALLKLWKRFTSW